MGNQSSPCPTCRAAGNTPFFALPGAPVFCNMLHDNRADAQRAPRGDIRLAFCDRCGMIYNVAFEPERVAYDATYENALHCSHRFQRYARQLAERLIEKHDLHGKPVAEIGCGDGYFLHLLRASGAGRAWGADPGHWPHTHGHRDAGVTIVGQEFRADLLPEAVDLICCRHVLEHLPDPRTFLAEVHAAASRGSDTVVFFEVPDAMFTLHHGGIWDILYEHCSYFTVPSLTRLFAESGFHVIDTTTAFGRQFLGIEARAATRPGAGRHGRDIPQLEKLAAQVTYFQRKYQSALDHWHALLAQRLQRGDRVVVWGAGTKGTMFLNTLSDARHIEHVVDINPRKTGTYVPCTAQQVVSPAALRELRPDAIVVMNPLYETEIRQSLKQLAVTADLVVA